MKHHRGRAAIIGCGYVGYPLALLAASSKFDVVAVDIDGTIIRRINSGMPVVAEESIASLAEVVHGMDRLTASPTPVVADVFVIAVPTPVGLDGRTPDLSSVEAAAESIAPLLAGGETVIVESTVPPGSCRAVILPILESTGLRVGVDVNLAHCPERVLPGRTMDELTYGDRVIGGFDDRSTAAARAFYASFSKGGLIETDLETAEFVKLMENAFRDVNIALANQIASLADRYGVDRSTAIRIANGHPRVSYLSPGIGVGGHCIPVDPWFLVPEDEDSASLIVEARRINDEQPYRIAKDILERIHGLGRPRVLLLGGAYKRDTSDVRNSPALIVRDELRKRGHDVAVYDPVVTAETKDLVQAAADADVVILMVPHSAIMRDLAQHQHRLRLALGEHRLLDATSGALVPFTDVG